MDGLSAFDDALTGRLDHCSHCGAWVHPDVIVGQCVALDGLQIEVFVVLCVACNKRWEHLEAKVLAMLEQRYGKNKETL